MIRNSKKKYKESRLIKEKKQRIKSPDMHLGDISQTKHMIKNLLNKVEKEKYEAHHVHVDELQNFNSLSFLVYTCSPEIQIVEFSCLHTISNKFIETNILVDPCEHFNFTDEQGKRILPLDHYILNVGDVEHIISIEIY
ncbi:hypothetical protein MTR_5g067030 [Medicago truncatula]|uniref:Uncharacterized protein n=1 Tax=Medicago truncatula TaxID=3880 RepID=G7K5Z2_MEDTR|nr:hypothetical protein MTR_5g067030 [Medicago truncatula]